MIRTGEQWSSLCVHQKDYIRRFSLGILGPPQRVQQHAGLSNLVHPASCRQLPLLGVCKTVHVCIPKPTG